MTNNHQTQPASAPDGVNAINKMSAGQDVTDAERESAMALCNDAIKEVTDLLDNI